MVFRLTMSIIITMYHPSNHSFLSKIHQKLREDVEKKYQLLIEYMYVNSEKKDR